MGLVTGLLTLPLAPVRGVAWVAETDRSPMLTWLPVGTRGCEPEIRDWPPVGRLG